MSQGTVFNQASLSKVLSIVFLYLLALAVFVLVLFWRLSYAKYRLLPFLSFIVACSGFAWSLIYILFSGGKSVTVFEDGIVVELWLSKIFHLNLEQKVEWHEIQLVEWEKVPRGFFLQDEKLHLHTPEGTLTFWTFCFNKGDLKSFRNILAERIGKDRIKAPPIRK